MQGTRVFRQARGMPGWSALAVALGMALCGGSSLAATAANGAQTKDIVLDQVSATLVLAPVAASPSSASPVATPPAVSGDALIVSVLEENTDGDLTPRATNVTLTTNTRFRIKVLASRDGSVTLTNINPEGKRAEKPLATLEVKAGQESISPRLLLTGVQGLEHVEIVLQPQTMVDSFLGWLTSFWQAKDKSTVSKDVVLDSYSTPQATYARNPKGEGVMTYVRIQHTAK